jgi:signal transduction histidine kinase
MVKTGPSEERKQLQRLKWSIMLLPMLFLSLYEAYAILVREEPLHRPLLEMGMMTVGSFVVVQTTFSIIFRLCQRNQRQQARLAALHQVDLNLSMSLDQEQVARAVLKGALQLTQGQIARAFVYDPEREGFESGWEYTDSDQYRSIDCKPPSNEFDARVIATREVQLVKDVTAPGSLPAFSDAARGIRAAVGIPLLNNDQMLGILDIGFDAPRTVSEGELETLRLLGTRAAAALDNARLFRDAVRERERARTLLETVETLGTTLRLDRLLERVLNGLQQVIPHNAASINLVYDQVCWPMASRGQVCISPERFLLAEFPEMHRAIQERTPVIISDTHSESHILPVESPGPVRAWMGVPLISKGEVTGVLTVESHQPDAYDEDMARFALVFARQVALAIENSRLYEQTRAQLREATLLHGVMVALASTIDVDQILPYMARSLCEILNAACAEIYSLDEESGTISIIAHHIDIETGELAKAPELDQVYALAEYPAAAEALDGRHPTQVRTTAPETSPRNLAMLEAHGAKATLILPMIARDRVLGFAQVWEAQISRRFTEAEIAVAQTLIHPASIAMENARLFGEIQHRMREIQLLHDVGLAAASGLRLEETLQAAVKALAVQLEDSRVAIMLLDPDSQELHLEASVGLPPDVIKDVRVGIGEGITGWVAKNGEAVLVPDVHKDPRYIELAPDTRSELCVPLTAGSVVIGVLNVENAQPAAYAEDDQRLLSILASNLTVLIERARLFEEVEAAKSELQSRAEALEEANVRLQELDQLKLQFLARVSHELRTPLNSIIGFSEVLLEGTVGEMTSRMKECVQIILTNGEHLLTLINDILDLSRIDAGRVELYLSTFTAGELLEETAETIRPMVEKKSQVLSVSQAEGIPPVTGDRFRIKQVLLNLLSNANKFTPTSGSIALTCQLADPETILFSVSDDGIGIGADDQKILFEDFRQVDGSVTRKASGAGLGLAISKRLVEMHGGRIWVQSAHKQGATFSFILPLNGPPHLVSE